MIAAPEGHVISLHNESSKRFRILGVTNRAFERAQRLKDVAVRFPLGGGGPKNISMDKSKGKRHFVVVRYAARDYQGALKRM